MVILSILIPSLNERLDLLAVMIKNINHQINECNVYGKVEVLTDMRPRGITTGEKRSYLLSQASGEYTVFVDDDDLLPPYYLKEILKALESKPDVVTFNGIMTTNGTNHVDWEIRLGHPYKNDPRKGKDYYLRFPNHLSPMKRELIKDFKFENITMGEDYRWAKKINDAGVLKSEVVIPLPMYHYKFVTK